MKKKIKKIGALALGVLLSLFLTGCPQKHDWYDNTRTVEMNNLVQLVPLQQTYNQGDVVSLKFQISEVSYNNETVNLFNTTHDFEAFYRTAFDYLFTGNELNFIKGSQGNQSNYFSVPYNSNSLQYEFEVQVTLNKTGVYSFFTDDVIKMEGDSNQGEFVYQIKTKIQGANAQNKIEFTVQ